MILDQLAHLVLRELERVFEQLTVRVKDELDRALWILAVCYHRTYGVNKNHGE